MTKPLLMIAAGGTGGHMFPAQALSEEMLSRGWRVKLSTDPRGARYTGGFPDEVSVEVVQASTFARGGILAKFLTPFQILKGVLAARSSMKKDRPDVIAGFGGYPAVPAMAAGGLLGICRLIHEQNGVLGRVNQLFAKRVDRVACGTWPTELPDGVEGIDVGNPVRAAILARAGADYIEPGPWPVSILVVGGSQGSSIVSQMAAEGISLLPHDIRSNLKISCQVRDADHDEVKSIFETAGVTADLKPFFKDMPQRLSDAQLVITRSGASTVADLSIVGRPSILIPLKIAIRDEQTANAQALVQAGAAKLIQEDDLTAQGLAQLVLSILNDPQEASQMAKSALSVGKPDAAKRLADLVEDLAKKDIAT